MLNHPNQKSHLQYHQNLHFNLQPLYFVIHLPWKYFHQLHQKNHRNQNYPFLPISSPFH